MIIAVLAKKGGVGKSMVSVLLYETFRQAGRTVRLHDWDGQGTSTKSLELIHGGRPERQADPEINIYDTPPSLDHNATATAARSADIALVVTSPDPADVWEAEEAVEFARRRNPNAIVRIVFNKVKETTILGRMVNETAKQFSVQPLAVSLTTRECYKHAIVRGWKALDAAARDEVLKFAVALLSTT
jgi:chromosome partitioning protein